MMKSVFGLIAGILLSTYAQSQPSAELEAKPLENNQWQVSIQLDEVENIFGLQAELLFDDDNILILDNKFESHPNWPKQGIIELRNSIKDNRGEYAASLVRPSKAITLDSTVLKFNIGLKELKPTQIKLDKLKTSNINGLVTNYEIKVPNLIIGDKPNLWPYYLSSITLAFFVLIALIVIRKRFHSSTNNKVTA